MATVIQHRRGTTADRTSEVQAEGELVLDLDTFQLYIGDGAASGGRYVGGPPTGSIAQNDIPTFDTTEGSVKSSGVKIVNGILQLPASSTEDGIPVAILAGGGGQSNKRVSLGYDVTGDAGYIGAADTGVTWKNLYIQGSTIELRSGATWKLRVNSTGASVAGILTVNTIDEQTADAGVVIEGVKLKDGILSVALNGFGTPPISFIGDPDTGLDQSIGNAIDIIAGGTIAATVGNGYASFNGYMSVSDYYEVDGFQVVGQRQAAIANPTGGTTIDTEARATIVSILTAMRTHGLIYS